MSWLRSDDGDMTAPPKEDARKKLEGNSGLPGNVRLPFVGNELRDAMSAARRIRPMAGQLRWLLHSPPSQSRPTNRVTRGLFTNADAAKRQDPFGLLGLSWGATITEIKEAYRIKARQLHPDVSKLEPAQALRQFRTIKEAYESLLKNKNADHRTDVSEEWAFAVWRNSDVIAQKRTDVAGVMKKRPVKPADSLRRRWGHAALGHPDGRGATGRIRRDEFLSDGRKGRSSSVGSGQSKWTRKKPFKPWTPDDDGDNFRRHNSKSWKKR